MTSTVLFEFKPQYVGAAGGNCFWTDFVACTEDCGTTPPVHLTACMADLLGADYLDDGTCGGAIYSNTFVSINAPYADGPYVIDTLSVWNPSDTLGCDWTSAPPTSSADPLLVGQTPTVSTNITMTDTGTDWSIDISLYGGAPFYLEGVVRSVTTGDIYDVVGWGHTCY